MHFFNYPFWIALWAGLAFGLWIGKKLWWHLAKGVGFDEGFQVAKDLYKIRFDSHVKNLKPESDYRSETDVHDD